MITENFRRIKPFWENKKGIRLNIVVHFYTSNPDMVLSNRKIVFQDYLYSLTDRKGVEIASGRFIDENRFKVEKGLINKDAYDFIKRVIEVLKKPINKERNREIYV